ncbi:MAG: outer membrane protein [Pirellulaceae bacterium]|jgi:outer membrane protein
MGRTSINKSLSFATALLTMCAVWPLLGQDVQRVGRSRHAAAGYPSPPPAPVSSKAEPNVAISSFNYAKVVQPRRGQTQSALPPQYSQRVPATVGTFHPPVASVPQQPIPLPAVGPTMNAPGAALSNPQNHLQAIHGQVSRIHRIQAAGEIPGEHAIPQTNLEGVVPGRLIRPWWRSAVIQPQRGTSDLPVDVQSLVMDALRYAPQVHSINKQWQIRETAIYEADAAFDTTAFIDSMFTRTSEPVGNTLTTGGPPRFREKNWSQTVGIRRKTTTGADLELSQQLGYQNNNSVFFTPKHQANSRLNVSFTQPLLQGAGRAYNTSTIVLAEVETGLAWQQSRTQLQNHLLSVSQAYWQLYLQRVMVLQKAVHLKRAENVLIQLEARQEVDVLRRQILRARSAVAARRTELVRAEAAVRNAETRIRVLVNSPKLDVAGALELLPFEEPSHEMFEIKMEEAVLTAMQNRPEMEEAMKQVHAANIRLKMSKNELLPILNVVLESYLSGLQGDYGVWRSVNQQFDNGEPSYSAGLVLEVPFGQRAAQARNHRRELERSQILSNFQTTMDTLTADVETSLREVNVTYQEIFAKQASMNAAAAEVAFLHDRWKTLPGDDQTASVLLESLLSAQNRLTFEEQGAAQAEQSYAVALLNLKRSMGTLLHCDQLNTQ